MPCPEIRGLGTSRHVDCSGNERFPPRRAGFHGTLRGFQRNFRGHVRADIVAETPRRFLCQRDDEHRLRPRLHDRPQNLRYAHQRARRRFLGTVQARCHKTPYLRDGLGRAVGLRLQEDHPAVLDSRPHAHLLPAAGSPSPFRRLLQRHTRTLPVDRREKREVAFGCWLLAG